MSKKQWLGCASLAALATASMGLPAWAEPQGPAPVSVLEEITVTARRVNENLQKVPLTVTSLSADALTERNVQSVTDLQFSVPNLQIKPNNTNPSEPEFILRGQRVTLYTDPNVVTYINGAPAQTRAITLYDLQDIQVLKGPQGTLFGQNSDGGAVVITPKRPTMNEFGGEVSLDVGNYGYVQSTIALNVPVVADKLAVRLAGQVERRRGAFKNLYPGAEDPDNRKNESLRFSVLAKPMDNLESLTIFDALYRDEIQSPEEIEQAQVSGGLSGIFADALRQQSAFGGGTPSLGANAFVPGPVLIRHGNPFIGPWPTGVFATIPTGIAGYPGSLAGTGVINRVWGVSNNTSYNFDDHLSVRNIASFRFTQAFDAQDPAGVTGYTVNASQDLASTFGPFAALLPTAAHASLFDPYYYNRFRNWTEEFQVIGNYPHLKFIGGGFFSREDFVNDNTSSAVIGPVSGTGGIPGLTELYAGMANGLPFVGPKYNESDVTTDSKALYAQMTYDFGKFGLEGLSLTAGVRMSWVERTFETSNWFSNGNSSYRQTYTAQTAPFAGDSCAVITAVTGPLATAVNNASQCGVIGKRLDKVPTYTISLQYQIDPTTMVYATTRRGFKAGGVNPSVITPIAASFGPEYLTDYEIGLKTQGRVFDMPYRVNLDLFRGRYKGIQTPDILNHCVSGATSATDCSGPHFVDLEVFNSGSATIEGFEFEGTLKPLPSVQVNVAYSYQDAHYNAGSVIPEPTAGPNTFISELNPLNGGLPLAGQRIPGVPRHQITVDVNYSPDIIPAEFATPILNVNWAYRSVTTDNGPIGVGPTPPYGVANARLTFDKLFQHPYSLAFWVSNITDRTYPLNCNDNLGSLGYLSCRWGEPRTYGVTGKIRF